MTGAPNDNTGAAVIQQVEDALAETCWCGHNYHNHTDSDTPACYWPLDPEGDENFWERTEEAICVCDGWWPMNEDAPEAPPFPLPPSDRPAP